MAPRGTGSANGRVAYQKLETLAAQDDIMRRARRDRARAEHRENGPIEFLWPLLFALCFILLVAVAIHGFTDHTSMGHGVGAGRRGGPDDPLPYDSLDPGDIGAVWTTARVLRHFRARTAADVRIAWDVADLAALDAALAPVAAKGGYLGATANDIVHVPVAWSKALAGNGGAGAPVVARSTHRADGSPPAPLHEALDRFWRGVREHDVVGRERGLMLSFRDPRAVVPGLRLVRELIRRRRLVGPLIVDAEILPGPGGFLPQMASVWDPDPPVIPDGDANGKDTYEPGGSPFPPVPGSDAASTDRSARTRRTIKFHPTAFVAKTKLIVPGAILSVGFSTHGGCVDDADAAAARAAYAAWYAGGGFEYTAPSSSEKGGRRRTSDPGRDLLEDGAGAEAGATEAEESATAAKEKEAKEKEAKEKEAKEKEAKEKEAKAEAEVMDELEAEVEAEAEAEAAEAVEDFDAARMAEAQAAVDELAASDDLKRQLEANSSTPEDELADEPETYDDLDPRFVKALADIDLSEEHFPFDLDAMALRNERYFPAPGWAYDEAMMQDAYWLFRNATWRGDVWFNLEACMLRPDGKNVGAFVQDNENPPYRRMLAQKLGYALVYHSRTRGGGEFDELEGWRKFLTPGGSGADERARPDRANTFVGDMRIYGEDGASFERAGAVFPPAKIPTQSEL